MPIPYFINYTIVKLASALTTTNTTLTLDEQGRFPTTIPTDYYFYAVIHDGAPSSQAKEIIRVTAVNNLTWTIERGQLGTTARNWPANTSYVEPIYTYQMFKDAPWIKFINSSRSMAPLFPESKSYYINIIKYFFNNNKGLILVPIVNIYYYYRNDPSCTDLLSVCSFTNIQMINIGTDFYYNDNYGYDSSSNPILVTFDNFVIKKGGTIDNKDIFIVGRNNFYSEYNTTILVYHRLFDIRKVRNNNTNTYEHNALSLFENCGYYERIQTANPPNSYYDIEEKKWCLDSIINYNKNYYKYYSDPKTKIAENQLGLCNSTIVSFFFPSTIDFAKNYYLFKDFITFNNVRYSVPIIPNTNIRNPKFYFSSNMPFACCSDLIDLHAQQANSTFSIGFNSTDITPIFNSFGRIFVKRIFFVCHSYTECTIKPVISITAANTAGNLVTNYTINVTGTGIYPIPFTNRTFSISGGSTNINRYIYTITLNTPPSPGICYGFFIIEYSGVQLRFSHS